MSSPTLGTSGNGSLRSHTWEWFTNGSPKSESLRRDESRSEHPSFLQAAADTDRNTLLIVVDPRTRYIQLGKCGSALYTVYSMYSINSIQAAEPDHTDRTVFYSAALILIRPILTTNHKSYIKATQSKVISVFIFGFLWILSQIPDQRQIGYSKCTTRFWHILKMSTAWHGCAPVYVLLHVFAQYICSICAKFPGLKYEISLHCMPFYPIPSLSISG